MGSWYHASLTSMGRSKGRTAVGIVAYATGERIKDLETGKWCKRNHPGDVLEWGTTIPKRAPEWLQEKENLAKAWNAATASETRKNSELAKHWNIALPRQASPEQQAELMREMAERLTERYQVMVTWAVHAAPDHGDDRNAHGHLVTNMRRIDEHGFGRKAEGLNGSQRMKEVRWQREMFADSINGFLASQGHDERVTHKSYKDRGIDLEPTRHLGDSANQAELNGEKTRIGDENRAIKSRNQERKNLDLNVSQAKMMTSDTLKELAALNEREAAQKQAEAKQAQAEKEAIAEKARHFAQTEQLRVAARKQAEKDGLNGENKPEAARPVTQPNANAPNVPIFNQTPVKVRSVDPQPVTEAAPSDKAKETREKSEKQQDYIATQTTPVPHVVIEVMHTMAMQEQEARNKSRADYLVWKAEQVRKVTEPTLADRPKIYEKPQVTPKIAGQAAAKTVIRGIDVIDKKTNQVMGLADFILGILAGPSRSFPEKPEKQGFTNDPAQALRNQQQRVNHAAYTERTHKAIKQMQEDMDENRAVSASDIQALPDAYLLAIKQNGNDHLKTLIADHLKKNEKYWKTERER